MIICLLTIILIIFISIRLILIFLIIKYGEIPYNYFLNFRLVHIAQKNIVHFPIKDFQDHQTNCQASNNTPKNEKKYCLCC